MKFKTPAHYRGFFKQESVFELETNKSASECAYELSNLKYVYSRFDKGENGEIGVYISYKWGKGLSYEINAIIVPIDSQKAKLIGTASRPQNYSTGCLVFFVIQAALASLLGLIVASSLFYALFPMLILLVLWELDVIYRNKLVELLKTTTGAVETTPTNS